jgi:hypothetical protein
MNGLKCKPMIGSQLSGGINRKRVVITETHPLFAAFMHRFNGLQRREMWQLVTVNWFTK